MAATIEGLRIENGVLKQVSEDYIKARQGVVVLPDSVTSIGDCAFDSCFDLTSITIPDSVTSIGYRAFYSCISLTSITIPDSVTSINHRAFDNCPGLTSITIPCSVTSIGEYAFRECTGLTSITIPDSMTSIGNNVFELCTGLTSITIPDSVTSIGYEAFIGCAGLTSITIPDSVTSIGYRVFGYCTGLTSITIPGSVTSIDLRAFENCTGLTSITIPCSVTSIDKNVFYGCTELAHIIINDSNKENYERIKALLPDRLQGKVIQLSQLLDETGLERGSRRDCAIRHYIQGKVPQHRQSNRLYQSWLAFREQKLKVPRNHIRLSSTLENLCLFAIKKGLKNNSISEKEVEILPPLIRKYPKTPRTPDRPNQILEAFNDWVNTKIHEPTQASSSTLKR